jgi:hypothetical protein
VKKVWSPKLVIEEGKPPRLATEDDRLEDMAFIVCARIDPGQGLMLPDNRVGTCNDCGAAVQFRPDVPRKMTKVCIGCWAIRQSGGNA